MKTESPSTEPATPAPQKPFWSPEFREGSREFNIALDDSLHNDRDAVWGNKSETIAHRRYQDLAGQGFNIKEIAALMGVTVQTVSNALRQPAARARMIEQSKKPLSQMREFLEGELMDNLRTFKEIRDNPEAKPSDRIAAASALTERLVGKAAQPIVVDEKPVNKMTFEELAKRTEEILSGKNEPESQSGGQGSN